MTDAPAEGPPFPVLLARGVARALAQRGYATLTEVSLANGRRADVMGLGRGGDLGGSERYSLDIHPDRRTNKPGG